MNSIRQTQALNKRELESAVPPSASWHADYRDTAYIYVGGFPFDLSEGDILTIFSQYGNPTHLNLVRDRETGKSKGFAFLKYEDQRSCDLAVDNLGGAEVLGRVLKVDHTRYKKRDGEDEDTWRVERLEAEGEVANGNGKRRSGGEETYVDDGERKRRKRAMIKEERELEELLRVKEGEEEDPMRQYLIEEKKQEIEAALVRIEKKGKHRHKHHHDKDRDPEVEREHRSHRHRDAVEENQRHKRHTFRDGDRDYRSGRREKHEEKRHSHRRRQRSVSDGEPYRSRSLSERRGNRETSRARSRDGPPAHHDHTSRRRRGPTYRRTPSPSLSPSRSRSRSRTWSRSLSRERRQERR